MSQINVDTNRLMVSAYPGARIALEVDVERHDVVDPEGGHVQEVARAQDDFVAHEFREVGELLQVGLGPVHLAVAPRRVADR